MTDYVTKDGFPDMVRVQQILQQLGSREAGIFQKRKEVSDRQAANRARREAERNGGRSRGGDRRGSGPPFKRVKEDTSTYLNAGIPFFTPENAQSNEVRNVHKEMLSNRNQENKSAAARLKELMKSKAAGSSEAVQNSESSSAPETPAASEEHKTGEGEVLPAGLPEPPVSLGKRKADAVDDIDNGTPGRSTPAVPASPAPVKENEMPEDTIKLWEPGYEERYYAQKFSVAPDDLEFRHKVAREYAKGLCWVLAYYMQGCPSWTWYFPYHYAPFAADFVNLEDLDPREFTKGKPFKPYEQLMGVLPSASNHAIPEPFRILMSDPNSPILDFYPVDFPIDLNGKKFAWQGVAILPFIDEKRLLDAMAEKYPELSDDENKRNETGKETLMFSQQNPLFTAVENEFYQLGKQKLEIDPEHSAQLHGHVEPHDVFVIDSQLVPPFDASDEDMKFELVQDGSMRVYYEMPNVKAKHAHKSMLLKGVELPPFALSEQEKSYIRSQNARGGRGGGRGGHHNGGRGGFHNGRGGQNGRGGYNGRGGFDNGRGNFGGPPPPFPYPPPVAGWNGQGVPPPPPGYNGPMPGPPQGWNSNAAQQYQGQQRPNWMQQQQPRGPPSGSRPPDNSRLSNASYYKPPDEILGRSYQGGGPPRADQWSGNRGDQNRRRSDRGGHSNQHNGSRR